MNKNKKKLTQAELNAIDSEVIAKAMDADVLSLSEIMEQGKAIEPKAVFVNGFSKPIMMKNVSFDDIAMAKVQSGSASETNASIVSMATGLTVEQALTLASGNAGKFTNLFIAVNQFLGFDILDSDLKK